MSTQGYQNQDFVNQTHDKIQTEQEQKQEELETSIDTRKKLESDPSTSEPWKKTPGRQIGVVTHTIGGESYDFGKPSGRATKKMMQPIARMEREGSSIDELSDYLWDLLGSWSEDGRYDRDHWADEIAMSEAMTLARNVAMGGNAQMPGT